jgi:hypothetical protein
MSCSFNHGVSLDCHHFGGRERNIILLLTFRNRDELCRCDVSKQRDNRELLGSGNLILHVSELLRLRQMLIISWSHAIGRSSSKLLPKLSPLVGCARIQQHESSISAIHLTLTTSSHHYFFVHFSPASQNQFDSRTRA